MYIKQVKRKCGVRGCKNTDCFSISRTREMGNSVIICKSCLAEALDDVKDIPVMTKSNDKKKNNTPPPLFFNAVALNLTEKTPDQAEPEERKEQETGETEQKSEYTKEEFEPEEPTEYVCPNCGRKFDSQRGLTVHSKTCKGAQ